MPWAWAPEHMPSQRELEQAKERKVKESRRRMECGEDRCASRGVLISFQSAAALPQSVSDKKCFA